MLAAADSQLKPLRRALRDDKEVFTSAAMDLDIDQMRASGTSNGLYMNYSTAPVGAKKFMATSLTNLPGPRQAG